MLPCSSAPRRPSGWNLDPRLCWRSPSCGSSPSLTPVSQAGACSCQQPFLSQNTIISSLKVSGEDLSLIATAASAGPVGWDAPCRSSAAMPRRGGRTARSTQQHRGRLAESRPLPRQTGRSNPANAPGSVPPLSARCRSRGVFFPFQN